MITVRDIRFNIADDTPVRWCTNYEFSVLANAIFITLPSLEPYFIHNVRQAAHLLTEASLREEAKAFIGQEARHAQQHRRYNEILAKTYPKVPEFEQRLRRRLDESKRRDPLAVRLAYTAGFEAITFHFLGYLFSQPERWFEGADSGVLAMFAWHAAEEIEHKSVAFDVLRVVDRSYWTRVSGFGGALLGTVRDILSLAWYMVEADGNYDLATMRRIALLALLYTREFGPTLRHYLSPDYRPEAHGNPRSMVTWIDQHRRGVDLRVLASETLSAMALDSPDQPCLMGKSRNSACSRSSGSPAAPK